MRCDLTKVKCFSLIATTGRKLGTPEVNWKANVAEGDGEGERGHSATMATAQNGLKGATTGELT